MQRIRPKPEVKALNPARDVGEKPTVQPVVGVLRQTIGPDGTRQDEPEPKFKAEPESVAGPPPEVKHAVEPEPEKPEAENPEGKRRRSRKRNETADGNEAWSDESKASLSET